MGSDSKLQACPYCGCADMDTDNDIVPEVVDGFVTGYRVSCRVCDCLGASGDDKAEAAERWDRRAAAPPVKE